MRRTNVLLVVAGLMVGMAVAAHWPLRAQPDAGAGARPSSKPSGSLQDALLKPYDFRFSRPTSLTEVAARLSQDLGGPVVLDLAALDRLEVKPGDSVQLDLRGVRLKTGLKLLLDQAGLSFRVVPEDNLMILTDKEGAEDPIDRVNQEVRELHRDIHEVQDTLDEVLDSLGGTSEEGARVRKPTIIEEMPAEPDAKPKEEMPVPKAREAEPDLEAKPKAPKVPAGRPRRRA
ncbi:hypothetical protein OJF2_53700 [Aquisphaera giovannonii]|uniref:Uncharacterized protein n=1 Tax=Aquisphaera giovannonii TaxID=406548 RepID=A0A5B9W9L6_9BACT|nr:hypothetical protein [Aquisphaera giovannonii]QEH36785.1 hypothetical protein OJF2_53700 [Aquisphaera giovannonii]